MQTPGTIIGNRYKVLRLLGQGGMSNIYICQDINMYYKSCAVKEFAALYADPKEQATALQHFQREGELLKSLSHRNIPAYYDFFQDNGRYYLAMEYIQGDDLGKTLEKAGGPLPELDVADWGMQCAKVLYYLHCHKPDPIIFRDVKPSNIIIVQGVVKLIDFGIARLFSSAKRGDTMRIGSPGYAPPEQYQGKTDQRSDIFALGMTLRHALTGKDPTLEPNPFIVQKIPILTDNPNVSPELAAIVEKAIRLLPEERYQNMRDLKCDLSDFLESKCAGRGRTTPSLNPALGAAAITAAQTAVAAPVSAVPQVPPTIPVAAPMLQTGPIPSQPPAPTQAYPAASPSPVPAPAPKPAPAAPPPVKAKTSAPPAIIAPAAKNQGSSGSAAAGAPVIVPVSSPKAGIGKIFGYAFKAACLLFTGAALAAASGLWRPDVSFLLPYLSAPGRQSASSEESSGRAAALSSPLLIAADVLRKAPELQTDSINDVYKYTRDRTYVREALTKALEANPADLEIALLNENALASDSAVAVNIAVAPANRQSVLLGAAAAQKYVRERGGMKGRLLKVNLITAESEAEALHKLRLPADAAAETPSAESGGTAVMLDSALLNGEASKSRNKKITYIPTSPQSPGYISSVAFTAKEAKIKEPILTNSDSVQAELAQAGFAGVQKVEGVYPQDKSSATFIIDPAESDKDWQLPSSVTAVILTPTEEALKKLPSGLPAGNTQAWILLTPDSLCPDAAEFLNIDALKRHPESFGSFHNSLQTADLLLNVLADRSGQSGRGYGFLSNKRGSSDSPLKCRIKVL